MSRTAPFVDEGLGDTSYLVELGERRALVLDPWRDPGPDDWAAATGRRLEAGA